LNNTNIYRVDFPVSQMANDLLAEVIPETVVRPKIDIDIFTSDKRSVTFRPRLLDRGFSPDSCRIRISNFMSSHKGDKDINFRSTMLCFPFYVYILFPLSPTMPFHD